MSGLKAMGSYNGVAKPLKVSQNGSITGDMVVEEIIGTGLTLTKGSSEWFDINMEDAISYQIIIAPEQVNASITVRQMSKFPTLAVGVDTSAIIATIIDKTNNDLKIGSCNMTANPDVRFKTIRSPYVNPSAKIESIRILHPSASTEETLTYDIKVLKFKSHKLNVLKERNIVEYRRSSWIPAGTDFPALTSPDALIFQDRSIIIDSLEWQTNHRLMPRIYIEIYKNGEWIAVTRGVSRDGSTASIHTAEYIQLTKTDMWEILEFDNESIDKFFKFSLRYPIYAPEGVRIYIKNASTTGGYSGGLMIRGREIV